MNNLCCVLDPWLICKNCDWRSCYKCSYADVKDMTTSMKTHKIKCVKPEIVMNVMYNG
jgi:hypothetical protein